MSGMCCLMFSVKSFIVGVYLLRAPRLYFQYIFKYIYIKIAKKDVILHSEIKQQNL